MAKKPSSEPKYSSEKDPSNRFRIRFEPDRKGKQYIVVFTKRWADRVDPLTQNPELRSKRSFETLTKAWSWAKAKAKAADRTGSLDIPLSVQAQLLGLASQMTAAGGDPIALLNQGVLIHQQGLDALEAISHGAQLVEIAADHAEDTLGDWITKYAEDPRKQKAKTHHVAVSNLSKTYVGLGNVRLKDLQNIKSAIKVLTPIVQQYCDRENVKRLFSLTNMMNRMRQIMTYTQIHTGLPTKEVLDNVTKIGAYKDLHHDLDRPKEDYALSVAEVLILIKHFSRPETFCPTYPILSALMGTRNALYCELSWEMFGGRTIRQDSTVKIPRTLLKTVRQGKTSRGIQFKIDAIPNLSTFLWWALWQEHQLGYKHHGHVKDKSMIRTMTSQAIREARNHCLQEWKHFFECEVDEYDEFNWKNAAYNSFRNCFITNGVRHPTVRDHVSHIADDYKSHAHYIDRGRPDQDEQAELLFQINPMYLELVDMDNKTVDVDFLYAPLDEKEERYARENDRYKKEAYRRILESHGVFPDPESAGAQTRDLINDDNPNVRDDLVGFLRGKISGNELFQNITKDNLLYWVYSVTRSSNLKQWVNEEIAEEEWNS